MVCKKAVKFAVLMLLIPFISVLLFFILSIYARAADLSYSDQVKYTYLITSIGAPADDTAYPSGIQFFNFKYPRVFLFQIPNTSLGDQYVVSFDFDVMSPGNRLNNSPVTRIDILANYVSTPGTVISASGPNFDGGMSSNNYTLFWGDSQLSSMYSQSFVIYGKSGNISHTLDAVDGTTYLSLDLGQLYINCMCNISNGWTMSAGEFGSLFIPTPSNDESKQVGISLTNISVKKVVGGDELLDETKKQTGILEDQKEIMEEQAETTKGIFAKIKDFFDNFFSRLGDFIKGLIIPSSEDLTTFLQDVNDWFSDRLGFIYYPFSLAIDLVSALAGGSAETSLVVPAFKLTIGGEQLTIWNEISINIDQFDIFKYVRFFTSAILAAGVVHLAVEKWDEWIGGHGTG